MCYRTWSQCTRLVHTPDTQAMRLTSQYPHFCSRFQFSVLNPNVDRFIESWIWNATCKGSVKVTADLVKQQITIPEQYGLRYFILVLSTAYYSHWMFYIDWTQHYHSNEKASLIMTWKWYKMQLTLILKE